MTTDEPERTTAILGRDSSRPDQWLIRSADGAEHWMTDGQARYIGLSVDPETPDGIFTARKWRDLK